jgi:hypothetical protein
METPAERWVKVEQLLDHLLDLPTDRRASYLSVACATAPALRDEVEGLLRCCDAAGFLDWPIQRLAGPLVLARRQAVLTLRTGRDDPRLQ